MNQSQPPYQSSLVSLSKNWITIESSISTIVKKQKMIEKEVNNVKLRLESQEKNNGGARRKAEQGGEN